MAYNPESPYNTLSSVDNESASEASLRQRVADSYTRFKDTLSERADALKLGMKKVGVITVVGSSALMLNACATEAQTPPTGVEVVVDTPEDTDEQIVEDEGDEETVGETLDKGNLTADHDPVVTPENEAALLESLTISASGSPEEKAHKVTEISNRWAMAGATPELYATWYNDGSKTPEDVANEAALKNKAVYAQAMYGENWADDTLLEGAVNEAVALNARNLVRFINTFSNEQFPSMNEKNTEAYTSSYENVTVLGWANNEESSGEGNKGFLEHGKLVYQNENLEVLSYTITEQNNSEANLFGDEAGYAEADGRQQYVNTLLVHHPDGTASVQHISYQAEPFTTVSYKDHLSQ